MFFCVLGVHDVRVNDLVVVVVVVVHRRLR